MKQIVTAFLLALLTHSAWAETPLRFGVLAFRPKVQAIEQWQPLATYLAAALGRSVKLTVYNTAELEAAVAHDAVDVLLTTPGQYILLQQRYGLSEPLVTQINQDGPFELSSFGGVLFTRTDAQAINVLSDVSDMRIAAVNSSIFALGGYQMQAFELLEAGLPLPDKDLLIATGMPQDRVVEAVLANRADVGFVRSGVLEALASEGKLDLGRIKVINRQNLPSFPYMTSTRLYPEWPVAVSAKADEHLARQISIVLLSLPASGDVARAAGIHGFTIAADYRDVENLLRRLQIPPFEGGPDFTLIDLWRRYAIWMTAFLSLLVAVLASGAAALRMQVRRVRQDVIELQAAKNAIGASELFANATFDAVSAHLCVLDPNGKILAVNQAWRDFLDENQTESARGNYGLGTNYLNICEASVGAASGEADPMAVGLRRVLRGECDEFVMEYPCHSPTEQRWFNAKATRFPGDSGNVVVAHETITAVKLAEQREQHNNRVLQMLTEKAPLARVLDVIARDMESMLPSSQCLIVLAGQGEQTPVLEDSRCWSQTIVSSLGQILGVLQVRHLHARSPRPADSHLLEDKARLTAFAIEKSEAEIRLQLAASVFTHAREGIVITDVNGTIAEVNDTFTLITGYARSEVLGQNPRLLHSGRQTPEFYKAMWSAVISKGHWYGEVWNRRKDGTDYAELLTISAVPDADGSPKGYVGLFTDITAIKEHAQQLEHIAHYDALTGLPNRVLLADRLKQAKVLSQRQNRALAVVVLDLDGFKTVNDAHGHNAGDELLIILAQRMKAALREGDTLARTGGDEFVAVLVDLEQAQDCEPVLVGLLQAVAAPAAIGDAVLCVSASMGVTLYPQDGVEADVLLRHADQAMYLAKQAGKNRYHWFDVAQDAAVNTQRASLERIRRALDEDEFVLYYQPKVNMKTGTVIGAEALIRWQHPERGLLAPADFLPVIESQPISVELGEWVINTALAQMTEWHAQGLVLGVSVNIGARQLQQGDFAARLAGLLAAHPAVEPRYLELEVLETSALEDMAQVSAVMFACSGMGVHFALDDFGTGYSSLTYLKRLPAEMLKIDQSFVRGMLDDPDDLAIVKGVIGLVTAFRRQVIAEGVETVAHGQLLLSLGCDLAQGYGIARPMPAQEFPGWVASWRPDTSWEVWRGRTPTRDDQVLVFAEVEHRHWLRGIEIFLAGDQDVPPRLDASNCHFGRWQETEGRARFGHRAEFAAVAALHDRVHALGRELIELHASGHREQVQRQINEIKSSSDQLIAKLRQLVQRPD